MDYCSVRARRVCEVVEERTRLFEKRSKLKFSRHVQELQWTEFDVGPLLGKGSFSSVYHITMNQKVYALKILRKKVMDSEDEKGFQSGAIDLVMESKLLQRLDHPNIIQLHGVKGGTLSESFLESGYFLVLEKLNGTLDESLRHWRQMQKTKRGAVPTLDQRLCIIAMGVASAMEYLHSLSICFRDLKPQNVGLASDGTVRMFDFGSAVELTTRESRRSQQYDISGQVGTARYMAPENALCQPYGLSSDVYSFGLILWEICTLKQVFKNLSPKDHAELVIFGKGRPPLKGLPKFKSGSFPPVLSTLIQECWHHDARERPKFSTVCRVLKQEYQGTENSWHGIATMSLAESSEETDVSASASVPRARSLLSSLFSFSEKDEDVVAPSEDICVSVSSSRRKTKSLSSLPSFSEKHAVASKFWTRENNWNNAAASLKAVPTPPTQYPTGCRDSVSMPARMKAWPAFPSKAQSLQDEDIFARPNLSDTRYRRHPGRHYESSSRKSKLESPTSASVPQGLGSRLEAVTSRGQVHGMASNEDDRHTLVRAESLPTSCTSSTRYIESSSSCNKTKKSPSSFNRTRRFRNQASTTCHTSRQYQNQGFSFDEWFTNHSSDSLQKV